MRLKKPVIENSVYSEILFIIGNKGANPYEITKKLNKQYPVILRQIKNTLLKEGFVKEGEKEDLRSRKPYFINWDKIVEEFYNTYFKSKKLRGGAPALPKKDGIEEAIYGKSEVYTIKKIEVLKKNKYLQKMFKDIFSSINHKYTESFDKIISIREIYYSIPIIILSNLYRTKGRDFNKLIVKIKRDEEFNDFLGLIYIIYSTYYKLQLKEAVHEGLGKFFDESLSNVKLTSS